MESDSLLRMANRIGEFFQAQPDAVEAQAGLADHLRKFWEPRMRRALYAALDAGEASSLTPFVREAIERHRARLMPASPAASPAP